MKIQSYKFGELKIDGTVYENDLIITEKSIQENWQRKSSHILHSDDLATILAHEPEHVIIGTGLLGLMKVSVEAKKKLREQNIKIKVLKTKRAIKSYKSLKNKENVILALHITC